MKKGRKRNGRDKRLKKGNECSAKGEGRKKREEITVD